MAQELVTIAREISALKANLMRTRLEADGIECFLAGETLASVVGSPSYIGVSIDVQVPAFDAMRARKILHEIESAPRDEANELWPAATPNIALEFLRALINGALIFYATIWVYGATQNWWLGAAAGAISLLVVYFLSLKNSFKSKR